MFPYRLLLILLAIACGAFPNMAVSDDAQSKPKSEPIQVAKTDWPWWRGLQQTGVAASDQNPPLAWSASENILWKAPVPGRGHGSPTIVGNRVFLATAEPDGELQSVLCFDRETGRQLWKTVVHRGHFDKKGNAKSSQASSTPACDGRRVYINFLNHDAVFASALSLDGELLWQTKICDFVNHQGFGASPALYESLVIFAADNKKGGAIAALARDSGQVVWHNPRPSVPNYTSPIILNIAGRDQLLFTGCDLVSSFEPLTGRTIWEFPGSTTECVTSTVTDGQRIFTSGGYPKNHMAAIRANGSGKVDWETKTRVYVPSLVIKDGYLYGVQDAGVAMCCRSDTGEEVWKSRLGGTFSASCVLLGDRVLATNEAGQTFIFRASPEKFELLAENQLGDEAFATPAICGDRIYHRVAEKSNNARQEFLYCLGAKP